MSGPRSLRVIELDAVGRAGLEKVTRRTNVGAGLVRQVRIVLLVADGRPLDQIARQFRAPTPKRPWVATLTIEFLGNKQGRLMRGDCM